MSRVTVAGQHLKLNKKFNKTFQSMILAEAWMDRQGDNLDISKVTGEDALVDKEQEIIEDQADDEKHYLYSVHLSPEQIEAGTKPYILLTPGVVFKTSTHMGVFIRKMPEMITLKNDPNRGDQAGRQLPYEPICNWAGNISNAISRMQSVIADDPLPKTTWKDGRGKKHVTVDPRTLELEKLFRAKELMDSDQVAQADSQISEHRDVFEMYSRLCAMQTKTLIETFKIKANSLAKPNRSLIISDILLSKFGFNKVNEAFEEHEVIPLQEIVSPIAKVKIPNTIVSEITTLEIDTIDEFSPAGKQALADDFNRAERIKNGIAVSLSDTSIEYLKTTAIPNILDIAKDNANNRLVNAVNKFAAKLAEK
jgi:hypothetical protein